MRLLLMQEPFLINHGEHEDFEPQMPRRAQRPQRVLT